MHLKKNILLIFTMLFFSSCYLEMPFDPNSIRTTEKLLINSVEVFFDINSKIALCPVISYGNFEAELSYNEYTELQINNRIIKQSETYDFGQIDCNKSFQLKLINVKGDTLNLELKFTLLPTISISHETDQIPDEPKIGAIISLSDPANKFTINEFCGIERRGGSANSWPKKSFGFEIHEDYEGNRNKDLSLIGMDSDDDWILDGLYSDKSCVRNRVTFDLWKTIQDDAIVQGKEVLPSATKGQYVEVFINNSYEGIYCLCQPVDGKNLGLLNQQTNETGYMYKCENWNDVSRFKTITDTINQPLIWEGWEQKYPKFESEILWKPLYNFTDFFVNSTNEEFTEHYSDYLVLDQLIDFYILVNIIKGYDNVGQNLILANKTQDAPFYLCPWDLDATWGRDWSGKERDEKGIVPFRIIERFVENDPNMFKQKLAERWVQLRDSIITPDNLYHYYDIYFDLFEKSGAGLRELENWPLSLPDLMGEKEYINTWINKRIIVLDKYFASLSSK